MYASAWGTTNEVLSEAEYQSSADIETRFDAALGDEGLQAASLDLLHPMGIGTRPFAPPSRQPAPAPTAHAATTNAAHVGAGPRPAAPGCYRG